jgi:xanthine/CO dehydrogenase XdhC/CoxF family maturation factor
LLDRDEPVEPPAADAATVAVIMTHNYEQDVRILASLMDSDVACIAALGPKRRTEQILDELRANGNNFTAEQMAKVYAPAGLDIGADTPEAIALSIAAEIQSVLRKRGGGHLRDRRGPIYDR